MYLLLHINKQKSKQMHATILICLENLSLLIQFSEVYVNIAIVQISFYNSSITHKNTCYRILMSLKNRYLGVSTKGTIESHKISYE